MGMRYISENANIASKKTARCETTSLRPRENKLRQGSPTVAGAAGRVSHHKRKTMEDHSLEATGMYTMFICASCIVCVLSQLLFGAKRYSKFIGNSSGCLQRSVSRFGHEC